MYLVIIIYDSSCSSIANIGKKKKKFFIFLPFLPYRAAWKWFWSEIYCIIFTFSRAHFPNQTWYAKKIVKVVLRSQLRIKSFFPCILLPFASLLILFYLFFSGSLKLQARVRKISILQKCRKFSGWILYLYIVMGWDIYTFFLNAACLYWLEQWVQRANSYCSFDCFLRCCFDGWCARYYVLRNV